MMCEIRTIHEEEIAVNVDTNLNPFRWKRRTTMRQITLKYAGACRRCQLALDVGEQALYEKSMGIFCVGHQPTEVEEIRSFRSAKAEQKAQRLEEWAEKRETLAEAQLNSFPEIRHDIAFITQPGHIPFRERMNQADNRAYESLKVAERLRQKAENLRNVRVAGDAERRRQMKRDAMDKTVSKGSRVHDFCFGDGIVVSVHKKSYRIKFDNSGSTYARDKSYVRPLEGGVSNAN